MITIRVCLQAQTNTFPASGNIGIGTPNPQNLLSLESSVDGGSTILLTNTYYNATDGSDHIAGEIRSIFPIRDGQYDSIRSSYVRFLNVNTISSYPGQVRGSVISFGTINNNLGSNFSSLPAVERMRIDSNGYVGIGTANPAYGLDVAGAVHATSAVVASAGVVFPDGNTQSVAWTGVVCGGDYAESVDVTGARSAYLPGDVLVIDADTPGKFLKSAQPYSTSVTGIYSTKPGTVGRRQTTRKSSDEVPMAMVGIVPTKVSSENGGIRPGDLLVTSSKLGYAMKGTDRSRMLGTVIGKALGNLDSATGVIEVVVTLQ